MLRQRRTANSRHHKVCRLLLGELPEEEEMGLSTHLFVLPIAIASHIETSDRFFQ